MFYNLSDYFDDIVRNHYNKDAIIYDEVKVSYSTLNKQATKIANFFLEKGVKSQDVIGIFNTKKVTGYATMLACLKIGVTYTNIDEENPQNRLTKILNTCKPTLLVSDHTPSIQIIETSNQLNIEILDLSINSIFEKYNDSILNTSNKVIGTTPAYIMFTSGSTGFPKGVTISHGNILSFLKWSINRYKVTEKDRFAQISPIYFDNSVFDFYTALFSGASLVPILKEITKQPIELIKLIDKLKCTIWFSVPSLLIYLQTMKVLNENTLKSIRIFTFGGEGFPKNELKKLYNIYHKQAKLINVYGPTEGTCICSSYDITVKDFQDMNILAPLGTINHNFEFIIIDENMQEVQKGEKGELCLIGPNIGLGYYNDLKKTNECFVQNPKIITHKELIYKTGDIVFEKDNLLWFVGRVDNQIKHMGYRIELEEIESALNGLKYVKQSAVLYKRININYGKIISYITTTEKIDELAIKNDLQNFLPEYMIPNIIEIKDQLPKNANGKIDKTILNLL